MNVHTECSFDRALLAPNSQKPASGETEKIDLSALTPNNPLCYAGQLEKIGFTLTMSSDKPPKYTMVRKFAGSAAVPMQPISVSSTESDLKTFQSVLQANAAKRTDCPKPAG